MTFAWASWLCLLLEIRIVEVVSTVLAVVFAILLPGAAVNGAALCLLLLTFHAVPVHTEENDQSIATTHRSPNGGMYIAIAYSLVPRGFNGNCQTVPEPEAPVATARVVPSPSPKRFLQCRN